ncbi:hypothetical protein [Ruminococcus sp.]|uniref:hypothetical protein n=1 Tax=Ruminococcus sp. TaxID=41978 RepID=UPI00386EE4D1
MTMMWPFVLGALGIITIITGVKIILTGKLSAREEEKLAEYSEKGAKTLKLLNAALNIVAGLVIIGYGVVRYLENQKIIPETIISKIVLIGVLIVMLAVYFIVRNNCKKM